MAQQLKEEVLNRILSAATTVFANEGFAAAKLTEVARLAEVSTGNIYRYFDSKEALFLAVAPRSKAAHFIRLIRARIMALATMRDWSVAVPEHSPEAGALLDFLAEEKQFVLTVLGFHGTSPLGDMRNTVIGYFQDASDRFASKALLAKGAVPQVVLKQIFTSTVDMIVAILRAASDRQEIERSFTAFWRYQLAGLQALLVPPSRSLRLHQSPGVCLEPDHQLL